MNNHQWYRKLWHASTQSWISGWLPPSQMTFGNADKAAQFDWCSAFSLFLMNYVRSLVLAGREDRLSFREERSQLWKNAVRANGLLLAAQAWRSASWVSDSAPPWTSGPPHFLLVLDYVAIFRTRLLRCGTNSFPQSYQKYFHWILAIRWTDLNILVRKLLSK